MTLETFLALVVGAVLGLFGQWIWHKYQRKEERQSVVPIITASCVERDGSYYVEVINTGKEGVEHLAVKIFWRQEGKDEERVLVRFFTISQNPITESSQSIQFLGASEKIRAANIPLYSDDGYVRVLITGVGTNSKKQLKYEHEIKVQIKPSIRFV